ncbi:MAG: D-alanyl-D-alanine carboxypeptidase [Magnetococcales bacterium]|nr:D-alanyl-D-alanine carboxypeptidase [Magnetococcales bacterium]
MSPTCNKTRTVKALLVFTVLVWALAPVSARADDERPHNASGGVQKVALHKAHKGKKSGKRRAHAGKRARHTHASVDSGASYADLVMDARTGRILHATAPDELRHPASLTKMMTLYLTFDAIKRGRLKLDQMLPISPNAASQEPSKLGLRVGRQIRVEDALLGLVTKSANDATVVLAEALGNNEEEFVRLMNNKARELGMTRTFFRNASGLPDPQQVTTARDMAILGYALIYHHPQFYPYFSRESFTYAGVRHANHNHLMSRYQGMDGIKTGYTRASGFNLVGSTVRGSTRLIVVVFGGRSAVSRDNKMAALMDQAFAQIQGERSLQRVASARENTNGSSSEFVSVPPKAPTATTPARQPTLGRLGNS